VMERVMEELSFDACSHRGERVRIDGADIRARLAPISEDSDLSRFIL
jgi:ATP-dependent HslUV protease ATP-binding subunit HslU